MNRPASTAQLAHFDAQHIWHPYGPIPAPVEPQLVESASGVYLHLADGRDLIDGMSSWWAACHGHSHPKLVEAATAQANTMSHVMFGGLTHRPAIELAHKLLRLAPGFDAVFYSDSGSVSVEVAIKMAIQYSQAIGHPERTRLATWRGGYHGDTRAPMSVCDPEGGMHAMWAGQWTPQVFADVPPARGASEQARADYLAHFDSLIDDSVAGVIVEPVVQGAGGMRFHDHELLVGLRELCDRRGILLIADEIATGFGRAGDLFTTQAAGIVPDIMCVGKALTGGFMSFAATLATAEVARAISSGPGGGLMHGPTFMGNPLACAVASAQLDLIAEGQWRSDVPRIEARLAEGLAPLANSSAVADVRVLGAIGVVEMARPVDMAVATAAAVDAGVWLRPFGKLVYTMPPYICTDDEVDRICAAIAAIVRAEETRGA
nr:adenosylmethionine--8-amino-7-oxononanoate transaminase [Corynebacterium lactis]